MLLSAREAYRLDRQTCDGFVLIVFRNILLLRFSLVYSIKFRMTFQNPLSLGSTAFLHEFDLMRRRAVIRSAMTRRGLLGEHSLICTLVKVGCMECEHVQL